MPPISIVVFPIFIPIDLVDIGLVHVFPALAAALELADVLAIAVLTKKTFAKEVQTTRPILDIYFGEFTYSLALSDSHVNCPSSGDNTKPLAKIEGYISLYRRMQITEK